MNVADFTGFSDDARALLRELPTYDKDRFAAAKKRWNAEVLDQAKAFVDDTIPFLQEHISPTVTGAAKVNGSISPINNDLRFSPDKAPYKDHLLIAFWDGASKKTAPVLHARIAADEIGFASGAMFAEGHLDKWRALVDDEATGAPLADAIGVLVADKSADVAGQAVKRVPKPFDQDHPRGELLKHKMLQVRWPEPAPSEIGTADFPEWFAGRLAATKDVHCWLRDHLYGQGLQG